MTNILKNGDYLVWETPDRGYELLRIIDMQPGKTEFKFATPARNNRIYFLSKYGQLMFTRFKVLEMYI
jgi:hypothetical protein